MIDDLLEPRLFRALERLQRFWLWNRRKLVEEVQQHVRETDAHTIRLLTHRNTLQAELEKLQADYAQLQSTHQGLASVHVQIRGEAEELRQSFDELTVHHLALQSQLEASSAELSQWKSAHQVLVATHQQLQSDHATLVKLLAERDAEYQNLSAIHSSQLTQFATLEGTHAQLQSEHENLAAAHQQLQSDHATLAQRLAERDAEYQNLSATHSNQLIQFATLEETHQQLQSAHDTLTREHSLLHEERDGLTHDRQLVQNRYDLVCTILNCERADNPALWELKGWLTGDFIQDVQWLELPAKATAHALEQASAIAQHVELLADAPALRDKFLVAVAGGFSTGKSSFVSSFMSPAVANLLPTGINPVTAIPTYVIPGKSLVIEGHTFKGAHMPLTTEAYGGLTHDFISKMGFNVKEIMPYVVLQAPMSRLEHIAFIDMPGYNPAQSDVMGTASDQGIASAALIEADAVIWLLGLDSNGTLPSDDIKFLLEHADATKPLYVVLNKADLRPENDVRQIVQEIEQNLADTGIACEGISAYSATQRRELLHHGKRLEEMLTQWDHSSSAAAAVHMEFESLMDALQTASQLVCKNTKDARLLARTLLVDIVELSAYRGGGTAFWESLRSAHGIEDRTQRLHEGIENKLQLLQNAMATTEWSEAASVLKNARERGHALLRRSCGEQERVEGVAA